MSTQQNLQFLSTSTIAAFKAKTGTTEIKVMRNPHTGKLFFAATGGDNTITGAVSGDNVPENPVISKVEGDDGQFYMIHKEAIGLDALAIL